MDISIEGVKPDKLSFEFKNELTEQLHPSDYDLAKLLYLQYDNENLLNQLLKRDKQFVPLGNYTQEYLDEQVNDPEDIVDYMAHFINDFKDEAQERSHLNFENSLQALFYNYVSQTKNNFLKQWFIFDRDVKNIIAAINCKEYNYNAENQLILTDSNNEVYHILTKSAPKAELLADSVPFVDEILRVTSSESDITGKEKAIDLIKWKFLDEQTVFNYFTIEKVLSYIIKLGIVERWANMDSETGKQLFNKLINDIKESYTFSAEYSL